ncbi:MAG TPA: hypothetical protein PLL10_08725, partial [Elusimicrobiales bacterium]|nr:hypothetical protein [Elusimicrobiales bacterium]
RRFADPEFFDLSDFAASVSANSRDPRLKAATAALRKYLREELVVSKAQHKGMNANGVSVYVPEKMILEGYEDSAWARDCSWFDFLRWMKGAY